MPRHPHPYIEEILDRNAARVIAHYEERHIRKEYLAQHSSLRQLTSLHDNSPHATNRLSLIFVPAPPVRRWGILYL